MPFTGCNSCGDFSSNLRGYRSFTLPQFGHVDAYIKHQNDHLINNEHDRTPDDIHINVSDTNEYKYTDHHFDNNNFGKWQAILLLFDAVLGN